MIQLLLHTNFYENRMLYMFNNLNMYLSAYAAVIWTLHVFHCFWHLSILKRLQMDKPGQLTQKIDPEVLLNIYVIRGLSGTVIYTMYPLRHFDKSKFIMKDLPPN